MADLFPVQLPAAGSLTIGDTLIVQQAGTPTVVEQATVEKVLEIGYSAATKTTPIAADTFTFFDSVSSAIRKLTWTNLLSALGTTFAALAGSASQTFSVASATSSTMAPQLGQINKLDNLLPNTNWQLFSSTAHGINQNSTGTAARTSISFTSFQINNGSPTFLTTNTQGLVAGELIYIDGLTTLSETAHIVRGVVANTSFIIQLQLGTISPAVSAAGTANLLGIGDPAGNTTGAASSGWNKTVTLLNWADDYTTNKCIGALRVMGIRKAAATAETLYHQMGLSISVDEIKPI